MYHQYTRYFRSGDLCSYKITAPEGADSNDILTFSLEFVENANVTLLKGSSLMDVFAAYEVGLGHSYTATADSNLYLQFVATSQVSGAFSFKAGYISIHGDYKEPTTPTEEQTSTPQFIDDTTVQQEESQPQPQPKPEQQPQPQPSKGPMPQTQSNPAQNEQVPQNDDSFQDSEQTEHKKAISYVTAQDPSLVATQPKNKTDLMAIAIIISCLVVLVITIPLCTFFWVPILAPSSSLAGKIERCKRRQNRIGALDDVIDLTESDVENHNKKSETERQLQTAESEADTPAARRAAFRAKLGLINKQPEMPVEVKKPEPVKVEAPPPIEKKLSLAESLKQEEKRRHNEVVKKQDPRSRQQYRHRFFLEKDRAEDTQLQNKTQTPHTSKTDLTPVQSKKDLINESMLGEVSESKKNRNLASPAPQRTEWDQMTDTHKVKSSKRSSNNSNSLAEQPPKSRRVKKKKKLHSITQEASQFEQSQSGVGQTTFQHRQNASSSKLIDVPSARPPKASATDSIIQDSEQPNNRRAKMTLSKPRAFKIVPTRHDVIRDSADLFKCTQADLLLETIFSEAQLERCVAQCNQKIGDECFTLKPGDSGVIRIGCKYRHCPFLFQFDTQARKVKCIDSAHSIAAHESQQVKNE